MQTKQKQILVIGGGAAGLTAAAFAAKNGAAVRLLERRERPARKILVTGKGRCNLTNNCDLDTLIAHVPRGGRFLYSAFAGFSPADTMALFESLGVSLKTERGNRVFTVSDRAMDIADALAALAKTSGVRILQDRAASLLFENGRAAGAVGESGRKYPADAVIVATGGLSYPSTGSTGDGYAFAKAAGHTIQPTVPSLIPLLSEDPICRAAQGLSLRNVRVEVREAGRKKPVYTDFGELLFTHFGLSGPTVLSASAHLSEPEKKQYTFCIDLKPALEESVLDARLLRDFEKNAGRDLCNALDGLLPGKLIAPILSRSGVDPHRRVGQVTREDRQRLISTLKGLAIPISGTRPVEEAVITRGGVSLKELDPHTMASRLCPGLYFAGEVIDADGYTGGFNLQIAFSTGVLAGRSAAESAEEASPFAG